MTDIDKGWKKFNSNLKKVNKAYTAVGFPSGAAGVTEIKKAFWNEFGTKRIPARPFLRTTFKKYIKKVLLFEQKLFRKVEDGSLSSKKALGQLGEFYVTLIQLTIRTGPWIPNAPATILGKGSTKPLIAEKDMLNSVTHVERGV